MSVVVVTVVAGRHDHLRTQRRFLDECDPRPELHVVVAVSDPRVTDVCAEQDALPTHVVHMESTAAGLPVAAARNRGAEAALTHGADTLVFLDVDCIPDRGLFATYRDAVRDRADALICGAVTYLPQHPVPWTSTELSTRRSPHPGRPDPAPGTICELPAELFWSLSFVVGADTWRRLAGFYEGYVGYGGEDTDLAATARALDVPILMAGGADAFHQHHPVENPPRRHLDDIVRNSHVYARRHGVLPMRGWLDAFRADGLLTEREGLPVRTDAVRVATVPARHEYLDAALPRTVERVLLDRVVGWAPDPLLEPATLSRHLEDIDVLHLHFGYEHRTAAELTEFLRCLERSRTTLMVTLHDLRNPHQAARAAHDAHLRLLLAASERVFTLTASAADECRQRFGREPEVVAHPTLLCARSVTRSVARTRPGREVLVPLKSLRANVRDPLEIVRAVRAGGAAVRVLVDLNAAARPELAGLAELDVTVDVRERLAEADLLDLVAAAHACVLPYRFGTHSGWLELCRDLGTYVIAPDCGHYEAQWDAVTPYGNNERTGLDVASLSAAVARVDAMPAAQPAVRRAREAQRDVVRALHDQAYRQACGR